MIAITQLEFLEDIMQGLHMGGPDPRSGYGLFQSSCRVSVLPCLLGDLGVDQEEVGRGTDRERWLSWVFDSFPSPHRA